MRRTIPPGPGTPPRERTWPRGPPLQGCLDALPPGAPLGGQGPPPSPPQQRGAFQAQVTRMVMRFPGRGTRLWEGPWPRGPPPKAYLDPLAPLAPPGAQAIPHQPQGPAETQVLRGNHCQSAGCCGLQRPGQRPPSLPQLPLPRQSPQALCRPLTPRRSSSPQQLQPPR